MPGRGICNKRIAWLLFLTPNFEERPSVAEWDETFNRNRIELENIKDLQRLERLNQKLDEVESDAIAGKLKKDAEGNVISGKVDLEYLRERRAEVKTEYLEIAKLLLKSMGQQVDREKPKKVDITHTKRITPMDIADQLRKVNVSEVVDVDVEKSNNIKNEG